MKQLLSLFICCLIFTACNNITPRPTKFYDPSQDLSIEKPALRHNMIEEGGFFSSPKYDGWIFTGDVRNNGTVVYKNIRIEVQYKNAAGAALTKENFTLNKSVAPGTTVDINQKLYPPNEMHEWVYGVTTASVVKTDDSH